MEPVSRLVFLGFTIVSSLPLLTMVSRISPTPELMPLHHPFHMRSPAPPPPGFGGAYTRSGLFSEFYGNYHLITSQTEPNRYYVSFMQTGFCPPAFITLGDSLSPDKPETRTKYETVFLCLNN